MRIFCSDGVLLCRSGTRANSGMEGMNLAFKEECTQRAVLPVREFVPELTTWLASRSIMDCEFAERVEIDKSDWNAAQPLTMDRLKGARVHHVK